MFRSFSRLRAATPEVAILKTFVQNSIFNERRTALEPYTLAFRILERLGTIRNMKLSIM